MTKIVIFEGCDASGKTTLYQEFSRAVAYQILRIDRFTGSHIVYDELYGRESKENWYEAESELVKNFEVYLCLMTAPEEVLERRIRAKETGKDLTCSLNNFRKADALFKSYFENSFIPNKKIIDTSKDMESCIKEIMDFVSLPPIEDPTREKLSTEEGARLN